MTEPTDKFSRVCAAYWIGYNADLFTDDAMRLPDMRHRRGMAAALREMDAQLALRSDGQAHSASIFINGLLTEAEQEDKAE